MVHVKNYVPVDLLRPHPRNEEYFSRPTDEEREVLKRSIGAEGIRDPLKVAPDYTVVAGHLRLEIAKELGLEKVPVEIVDGDPEYLEYLLVADNEERRICRDPIRKARRAEFLARYWGVRQGSLAKPGTPEGKFSPQVKTLADVAEAVGETQANLKKLLKLNDLIPPLQDLVSEGRLSQTAAYSLAFLPPEEQEELLRVLGESGVCGLSVSQARDLRAALEAERAVAQELERRLAEAERRLARAEESSAEAEDLAARLEALRKENEELKRRQPEVVEKVVEKVVYRPDPAAEAEKERLARELEFTRERFGLAAAAKEELEDQVRALREERKALEKKLEEAGRLERPEEKRREELLRLLDKAGAAAKELGAGLERILRDYPGEMRKISGCQKDGGLEGAVEVLADAVSFRVFKLSVDYAADRLVDFYRALEERKLGLVVLRGGRADAQKAEED